MKVHFTILLIALIALGATALHARNLAHELRIARAQIEELKDSLDRGKSPAKAPSIESPSTSSSLSPVATPEPPLDDNATADNPLPARESSPLRERAVAWRVQWQSREVEQTLALTEDERDRLRAAFEEQFRRDLSTDQGEEVAFDEARVIEDALGSEIAERYRAARLEREDRRIANEIEEETALLSRRLALDGTGESILKDALEAASQAAQPVRTEIRARMRSAMRSHSGAESDQASLQARYDEIRALTEQAREIRREALIAELRGRLTDEQLNEILSYQATRYE